MWYWKMFVKNNILKDSLILHVSVLQAHIFFIQLPQDVWLPNWNFRRKISTSWIFKYSNTGTHFWEDLKFLEKQYKYIYMYLHIVSSSLVNNNALSTLPCWNEDYVVFKRHKHFLLYLQATQNSPQMHIFSFYSMEHINIKTSIQTNFITPNKIMIWQQWKERKKERERERERERESKLLIFQELSYTRFPHDNYTRPSQHTIREA